MSRLLVAALLVFGATLAPAAQEAAAKTGIDVYHCNANGDRQRGL